MNINVLLFDRFETLDAMGPVEMLARPANYTVGFFSIEGGTVTSSQGVPVVTRPISDIDRTGTLLLPGGWGVRGLDSDRAFLTTLKSLADDAEWVLSVCNGSVLLSACGALDERKATSNKKLFQDALDSSGNVAWIQRARWVVDGKFYTASGVSAGIDMALGFMSDRLGRAEAEETATAAEYLWNDDPTNDPFYRSSIS